MNAYKNYPWMLSKQIKLIGIAGKSGSGKTALADGLEIASPDMYLMSFADPLKAACSEAFQIPEENFYLLGLKEVPDPFWGVSPRQIAQFVGTELFRERIVNLLEEKFDQDFWIASMVRSLDALEMCERCIIPDVRFPNEVDFILANGGSVIHLTRPGASGKVGILGHASESDEVLEYLRNCKKGFASDNIHFIENVGTVEELLTKAKAVI